MSASYFGVINIENGIHGALSSMNMGTRPSLRRVREEISFAASRTSGSMSRAVRVFHLYSPLMRFCSSKDIAFFQDGPIKNRSAQNLPLLPRDLPQCCTSPLRRSFPHG